jgi:hypothetical protein
MSIWDSRRKKIVKTWNIFLLSQPSLITKVHNLAKKLLEKEDMNGIKLALILEFVQES